MLDYNNNTKGFFKKNSKLLNKISKQNTRNSFLLDNLTSDLYTFLLKLFPEKIALVASINSRDSFEYFLDYNIEDIKLILKNKNNSWSLCYKVYPSYLNVKNKIEKNSSILDVDATVISLKDFYEKNVKKYYN